MDLQQFLNGAISGSVGIMLSHPIDTCKTYIQNKQPLPKSLRIVSPYHRNIGSAISTLYRGIGPAISGVAFEKAIVFGVYENMIKVCIHNNIEKNYGIVLSGGLAGLSASIVVAPVDRLKILAQSGQKINITHMNPYILFHGISATFTREVPGFALYFLTFENLKKKYTDKYNCKLPVYQSFLYGGISGATAWCAIYPQDVVKTRMQTVNNNIGFMATFRQVIKERMLFKGFHLALARAIPLHAGTFMTMEIIKNNFSHINE